MKYASQYFGEFGNYGGTIEVVSEEVNGIIYLEASVHAYGDVSAKLQIFSITPENLRSLGAKLIEAAAKIEQNQTTVGL